MYIKKNLIVDNHFKIPFCFNMVRRQYFREAELNFS